MEEPKNCQEQLLEAWMAMEVCIRGNRLLSEFSMYEMLDVEVPAENLCNRYTARMVANVKIGPSPKWLRQRLRANGNQAELFLVKGGVA